MIGVDDHILHGFGRSCRIAGQAGCVMAGLAVVIMAAKDIRPVEGRVAVGAGLGINLANVSGSVCLIDLHAMVD